MFDTIKAYYIGDLAEKTKFVNVDFVPIIDAKGVHKGYKAEYRNIKIFLSLSHRLTIEGSLSRFAFGDNFGTIDRKTTKTAILELCEFLGIPPKDFKVTRLDVATIIPATEKIETLQNVLGGVSRCKRWESGKNGIYWGNKQKQMVIYNKTLWAKETKTPIPKILEGGDWIRAEFRILKNIGQQTNYKNVSLDKLYNSGFYCKMCDVWENSFLSIEQMPGSLFFNPVDTATDLFDVCFVMLQSAVKATQRQKIIDNALSLCSNKVERHRFREKLKKVNEKYKETEETPKGAIYNAFREMVKSSKAVY